jgi:hypothetical protein
MINEWWIWKDLERCSHGIIKILYWQLPRETEENREKLRIAGVTVEMWIGHLLNTVIQHYCYTSLFGMKVAKGILFSFLIQYDPCCIRSWNQTVYIFSKQLNTSNWQSMAIIKINSFYLIHFLTCEIFNVIQMEVVTYCPTGHILWYLDSKFC